MNIEFYVEHEPKKRVKGHTCCDTMFGYWTNATLVAKLDKTGLQLNTPLGESISGFHYCPWCGEEIIINVSSDYDSA